MRGFETPTLRMRPMLLLDMPLFRRLYGDDQTMQHIAPPVGREAAESLCSRIVRGAAQGRAPFLFAMEAAAGPIGLCGVVQLDPDRGEAEVGMMLLPHACAQGYASEALPALIDAAFMAFSIDRVWVQYHPAHQAAERLVMRVGLLPCRDGDLAERHSENRVWAVDRPYWTSRKVNSNEGKDQCRA